MTHFHFFLLNVVVIIKEVETCPYSRRHDLWALCRVKGPGRDNRVGDVCSCAAWAQQVAGPLSLGACICAGDVPT